MTKSRSGRPQVSRTLMAARDNSSLTASGRLEHNEKRWNGKKSTQSFNTEYAADSNINHIIECDDVDDEQTDCDEHLIKVTHNNVYNCI